MGGSQSVPEAPKPQTQPMPVALKAGNKLSLRELISTVNRFRQNPQNEGRDLFFTAINPATGAMERCRFISQALVEGAKVRWGRYFVDEDRYSTTCEVPSVREAVEPFNPFITAIQTVAYPIPLYQLWNEVDLYDEKTGDWRRGVIVGIETFYYVFREIDMEMLGELAKNQPPPLSRDKLAEERKRLMRLSVQERLDISMKEAARLRQEHFERVMKCIRHDLPPLYIRKNSARLRRVLNSDPFFTHYTNIVRPVDPTFVDICNVIADPLSEQHFKLGFYLKIHLPTLKLTAAQKRSKKYRGKFLPGVLDRLGRLQYTDPNLDAAPVALFEGDMSLNFNEQMKEFFDNSIYNWRDAHALLAEHRYLFWEEHLASKFNFYLVRTDKSKGNSLFAALSDQIFGTQDNANYIRHRCLTYISEHRDYFQQFVDIDFEYYLKLKAMGMEPEYLSLGDHLDIQAVCEIFDCACELYCPQQADRIIDKMLVPYCSFYTDLNRTLPPDAQLPIIRLSYWSNDEYDSIHYRPPENNQSSFLNKDEEDEEMEEEKDDYDPDKDEVPFVPIQESTKRVVYKARVSRTDFVVKPPVTATNLMCIACIVEFPEIASKLDHLQSLFKQLNLEPTIVKIVEDRVLFQTLGPIKVDSSTPIVRQDQKGFETNRPSELSPEEQIQALKVVDPVKDDFIFKTSTLVITTGMAVCHALERLGTMRKFFRESDGEYDWELLGAPDPDTDNLEQKDRPPSFKAYLLVEGLESTVQEFLTRTRQYIEPLTLQTCTISVTARKMTTLEEF